MTVTMESLAAMPAGARIRVQDRDGTHRWTRTEDNMFWERDGVRLPDALFTGAVADGSVVDYEREPPVRGQVYTRNAANHTRYRYLVVSVTGNSVLFWRFTEDGAFTREVTYNVNENGVVGPNMHRLEPDQHPVWVPMVLGVVNASDQKFATQQHNLDAANTMIATLNQRLRQFEEQAAQRPGVVTVMVSGQSQVPTEKADGHVPETARVDSVVARWQAVLEYQASGSGCLCAQVSPEWIAANLNTRSDQPTGAYTVALDCGRHAQA